jgi:putative Holliday junction resolvase
MVAPTDDAGPILGVDLGSKRIGLAVSDPNGSIAFPAGHLACGGPAQDLKALSKLIEQRGIKGVVVGLPIHLSGRPSTRSEAARKFADELARMTGLPVELLDERWTTVAADRSLDESKRGRKRRAEAVDSVAATLLLRTYLERRNSPTVQEPR